MSDTDNVSGAGFAPLEDPFDLFQVWLSDATRSEVIDRPEERRVGKE